LEVFLWDGNLCGKIILWTLVSATLVLPPMMLIFESFPLQLENLVYFSNQSMQMIIIVSTLLDGYHFTRGLLHSHLNPTTTSVETSTRIQGLSVWSHIAYWLYSNHLQSQVLKENEWCENFRADQEKVHVCPVVYPPF